MNIPPTRSRTFSRLTGSAMEYATKTTSESGYIRCRNLSNVSWPIWSACGLTGWLHLFFCNRGIRTSSVPQWQIHSSTIDLDILVESIKYGRNILHKRHLSNFSSFLQRWPGPFSCYYLGRKPIVCKRDHERGLATLAVSNNNDLFAQLFWHCVCVCVCLCVSVQEIRKRKQKEEKEVRVCE